MKLIIEHYPNYFGLIKQFKIVVKAIEGEVATVSAQNHVRLKISFLAIRFGAERPNERVFSNDP